MVVLHAGSNDVSVRVGNAKSYAGSRLRQAELLAAVSLATDLAHALPFESALRDALLALKLAQLAGAGADDLADIYYLAREQLDQKHRDGRVAGMPPGMRAMGTERMELALNTFIAVVRQ